MGGNSKGFVMAAGQDSAVQLNSLHGSPGAGLSSGVGLSQMPRLCQLTFGSGISSGRHQGETGKFV